MFLPVLSIIGIGIIFIISLFYEKSWTYNWSEIRQQIKDSVRIAEHDGISSGVVGYDARKPAQFDRRHWIMKNATTSELLKLTEYPNGTIKTIAYEGLIRKREYKNKNALILKAIADTEYPIHYQSGCVGSSMNIGEYLVDVVLQIGDNSPPPPKGFGLKFGLSEKECLAIVTKYRKTPSLWR
ncbi:hypothetical protein [Tenacibaculum amylolyticum]|uniref:hypothetical protein n=1 Tax=Tenacibaculum amylolyticum TaxID=104269 RepID=UPI0038B52349